MSKNASQSEQWKFNVSQLQLKHPVTGNLLPGQYGNFRDDTAQCVGVTSDHYGIIQNTTLVDAAREAFASRGLAVTSERILTTGEGGRKFYAQFTFGNRTLATRVGEVFATVLTLTNSFDRSSRAAFQLGFLRLACLNGAATLTKDFAVTQKHSSNVDIAFIGRSVASCLAKSGNALEVFDELGDVEIDDIQGENILSQLVVRKVMTASLKAQVLAKWQNPTRAEDKERNLHNLYNAVTDHLTHDVAGQRFEYARKTSSHILENLVRAVRNREYMGQLLLPPPSE